MDSFDLFLSRMIFFSDDMKMIVQRPLKLPVVSKSIRTRIIDELILKETSIIKIIVPHSLPAVSTSICALELYRPAESVAYVHVETGTNSYLKYISSFTRSFKR